MMKETKDLAEIFDDGGFDIKLLKDFQGEKYKDIRSGWLNIRPWCSACVNDDIIDVKMRLCPEKVRKCLEYSDI